MTESTSTDEQQAERTRRIPLRQIEPERAVQSFAEVSLGYSRDEAVAEARRAGDARLESASAACPFGVDVSSLVRSIAAGDFEAAHRDVLQAHPWPGILGRYCHKYCERSHDLGAGIEPLFISALERAAAEHGAAARRSFIPGADTGRKIAILGTGPAASAAAYRLRQCGHRVVMIERLAVPGGMLAIGYPSFRLPLEVVARENALADWGVELRLGTRIDRAEQLHELLREFDAVVIGTGKTKSVPLGVPGDDLDGVIDALEFLANVRQGRRVTVGPRVVVFGAGYTAQDASRTVRRLGCEVRIFYRRSMDEMPVNPRQRDRYVRQQEAEGAPYEFCVAPVRVVGERGRVVGVRCARTEMGEPDDSGRAAPKLVDNSEFFVPCDTVLVAAGQTADLSFLPPEVRLTPSDHIWTDTNTFETSVPRLYAIGTVAGKDRSTVEAFKSGFDCANALDRQLREGQS